MVTKQQLKFIRSLHQKKFRQMYGKFLVEGDKPINELLTSKIKIDSIYSLKSWQLPFGKQNNTPFIISENDLKFISTHENPNQVVAVADIPNWKVETKFPTLKNELALACDNLNDPGNAGTIIRTAEWFGIEKIFFSKNSVDVYNPKTVSAAKGSLFRVECIYGDLKDLFETNKHLNVYGTFLNGENIFTSALEKKGIIVLGNEANGISAELHSFITHRLSIPSFGKAESLNAAIAAAIVISEFKNRFANW